MIVLEEMIGSLGGSAETLDENGRFFFGTVEQRRERHRIIADIVEDRNEEF